MSNDDFKPRLGRIRDDGRLVHDMLLVQVKTPAESTKAWDLYNKTLLPNVAEGLKVASQPKPNYDRMIEMKVSLRRARR